MELLALHVDIMEELRQSGVIRSSNTPTGDLAEFLFCQAFSWQQATKSEKGFDARDSSGIRYQIKSRRLHRRNNSRQLSFIRDFSGFEILAALLFGEKFDVYRAALIPKEIVQKRSKFVSHTNGFRFILTDDVWDEMLVTDVTEKLQTVASRELKI